MALNSFVLPIPDFEPDNDVGPAVSDMLNVVPDMQGWRTGSGVFSITADGVSSRPLGGITAINPYGAVVRFFGTATKLYWWNGVDTIADLTRTSGGDYATTNSWQFELFGQYVVAVNGVDEPQYLDLSGPSIPKFADLSGAPMGAQYVRAVGGFLFMAKDDYLYWSALENILGWTPGEGGSDVQQMPNGGYIRGLVGFEDNVIIGQRNKIRIAQFTPTSPYVFSFSVLQENIGVRLPFSMVPFRNTFAWAGEDGFYLGTGATPIGRGRVDDWFYANIGEGYEVDCKGAVDNSNNAVVWTFPTNSTYNLCYGLAYDYILGKWFLKFTPSNSDIVAFFGENRDTLVGGNATAAFGFERTGGTGDYYVGSFDASPTTCQVKISDVRAPVRGKSMIGYVKYLDDIDYGDGETVTVEAQQYSGQGASGGSTQTVNGTVTTAALGRAWLRIWGEKFNITLNADTGDFKNIEIGFRQAGFR